jgi:hypothetical protein
MVVATKQQILSLNGPQPLSENFTLPGTELMVRIRGIVRSFQRSLVYREIEEMAALRDVAVDGERIPITEDDIVAACWAAACVTAPVLSSIEWLGAGARNSDLLGRIGERCLVCSRLLPGEETSEGVRAAELEAEEGRDPLACLPSGSASTSLEGCLARSRGSSVAPGSGTTKLSIV